jgi:hypothetical protein
VCLVLLGYLGLGRGQPKEPKEPPPKGKPTPGYFGTDTCAQCHTKPPEYVKKPFLCRCTEFTIWKEGDKHQLAFKSLRGERGQRMGKLLGYDATKSPQCLSCHGVVFHDKKLEEDSKEIGFTQEDGVSCVVCHGGYIEWARDHGLAGFLPKWRKYSREKKETEFGMRDLWNPVKRAATCASCHVGNAAEGKILTHDMYAAGHPPLPSFEAATFGDEMPRHWQYLTEKPAEVREILGYSEGEMELTKLVLISGAVSLHDTMDQLGSRAKEAAEATTPDQRVLDFAQFDCYACHHDLKSPSWRQEKGYPGKPGRPGMRPWVTDLVRVAVTQARGGDEAAKESLDLFQTALRKVGRGFDSQPFGDPAAIAPAARELADWASKLGDQLHAQPLRKEDARRILATMTTTYSKKAVDYDSARQLAWAFRVIYREAIGDPSEGIKNALNALDQELKLQLPSGLKRTIEDALPTSLRKLNDYNPEKFKEAMGQLASAMAQK